MPDPRAGQLVVCLQDTGKIFDAQVTTDHAASSYGLAVLVVAGEAVGTEEFAALWQVMKSASDPEAVESLRAAGYRV